LSTGEGKKGATRRYFNFSPMLEGVSHEVYKKSENETSSLKKEKEGAPFCLLSSIEKTKRRDTCRAKKKGGNRFG